MGCFLPNQNVRLINDILKPIQDIKRGDIVFSHDEQPHEVLDTFEYDCAEEIAILETENNKKISCTKDHKIFAIKKEDWDKGIREPQWYPADELDDGDMIAELD